MIDSSASFHRFCFLFQTISDLVGLIRRFDLWCLVTPRKRKIDFRIQIDLEISGVLLQSWFEFSIGTKIKGSRNREFLHSIPSCCLYVLVVVESIPKTSYNLWRHKFTRRLKFSWCSSINAAFKHKNRFKSSQMLAIRHE